MDKGDLLQQSAMAS